MDNNKLNGHEIALTIITLLVAVGNVASLIIGVKNPRNKIK